MLYNPEIILLEVPLEYGGRIQFGFGIQSGMKVGLAPLMAKIEVTEGTGLYPDEWFCLSKERSILKIKGEFAREGAFLPDWLLLDCYKYHWEQAYWKSQGLR